MGNITYIIDGETTTINAAPGKSLLKIGLEAGLMIESSCGGNGFCTTCMCTIKEGNTSISPMNDNEESMGLDEPERLSCQAKVIGDEDITITIDE